MGHRACETGTLPEWECVDIANFAMMIADKSLKRKALEGKELKR